MKKKYRRLLLGAAMAAFAAALTVGLIGTVGRTFALADTEEEDNSSHVHVYTEGEKVLSSCTGEGYTLWVCECGDSYRADITEPLGHDYIDITVEPGCVSMGATYHICSVCGAEYVSDYMGPLGHDYSCVRVMPTCTDGGYTEYTCRVCGSSYRDSLTSPLGHSYVSVQKEVSCTEGGYIYYYCSACGDSYTEYKAAAGHDYAVKTFDPTCISYGYTEHVCMVCGDRYVTDYTSPLGHSFFSSVVSPSGDTPGYTVYTCSVCGYIYVSDISLSGDDGYLHDYVSMTVEPTCTEGGYTLSVCLGCGDERITDTVPALGHDYVLTCEDGGCEGDSVWEYVCSRCGDSVFLYSTAAPGHSYRSVAVEPTCTEGGYTLNVCAVCGHTEYTDVTPATGHVFSLVSVTADRTKCSLYAVYECICGESGASLLSASFSSGGGVVYSYPFDASGCVNFSSLPSGSYTVTISDGDIVLCVFTLDGTASGETEKEESKDTLDTEKEEESGERNEDKGEEDEESPSGEICHVPVTEFEVDTKSMTVRVTCFCALCGEDIIEDIYVQVECGGRTYTLALDDEGMAFIPCDGGEISVRIISPSGEVLGETLVCVSTDTDGGALTDTDDSGTDDMDTDMDEDAGDPPGAYEDGDTDGSEDEDKDKDTDGDTDADGDEMDAAGDIEDSLTETAPDGEGGSSGMGYIIAFLVFLIIVVGCLIVWLVIRARKRKRDSGLENG